MNKKVINILIVVALIILLSVGVLFILDKATGSNTFESIRKAIDNLQPKPEEEQEVVDTTPIEITYDTKEAIIYEPTTAITLSANKEIEVEDTNKYNLVLTQVGQSDEGVKYY